MAGFLSLIMLWSIVMFRPLLVSVFCLGFSWGAVAQQTDAPRPMSAVDMVELNRLSSADLSPDGRYLLYKRSETNWDENKIVRRFVLMDLETGEYLDAPNPEDETDSARSAWWTADGSAILYLERDEDKIVQLHQFDMKTGNRPSMAAPSLMCCLMRVAKRSSLPLPRWKMS